MFEIIPQTEEAIGCAEALGVPVVVALNKVDLLDAEDATREACGRLAAVEASLREFVALARAPVVPVSALGRSGLEPLAQALEAGIRGIGASRVHGVGVSSAAGVADLSPGPSGVVLDLTTRKGEGAALHVLLQHVRTAKQDQCLAMR